jgi:sulfate adenylyltransferase subunit 2
VREWNLSYVNAECPPIEETDPSLPPNARAAARKTLGLKRLIEREGFRGILLGIRRDEQPIRGKERVFSPRDESGAWDFRDQPAELWDFYKTELPPGAHLRIHPLLAWTELDIWRYIQREQIPVVPLYFARDGKRYRSLGEKNITFPIESTAATIDEIIAELQVTRQPERAGRAMDHEREDAFERLRSSGYM